MKRKDQYKANAFTIRIVAHMIAGHRIAPSYKKIVSELNAQRFRTNRGNEWTSQRLFRMLQRNGISGLHGLLRDGYSPTNVTARRRKKEQKSRL